jgi:hypothetical protein
MANELNFWRGDDTGNEGDAATAANWSLGHTPLDNEIVIFDDKCSGQSITEGFKALSGKNLNGFYELPSFTGDIAAEGDALTFECSTGRVLLTGQGNSYIQCGIGGASANAEIACIIIDKPVSTKTVLSSEWNNASHVCKFTSLLALKGNVQLIGDSDVAFTANSYDHEHGTFVDLIILNATRGTNSNLIVTVGDLCWNEVTDIHSRLILVAGELTTVDNVLWVENMGGKHRYIGA